MDVFNALKEIFSKSVKLKFLAYSLLWLVLALAVLGIVGIIFLVLFIAAIVLAVSNLAVGIALAVMIAVIGFIMFAFASMFLEGILLNIAKDFLEGKSFSFENGIEKTKPRFVVAALQQIIVGIAVCAFLLLIFTPAIINAVSLLTSEETLAAVAFAMVSEDSSLIAEELGILLEELLLQVLPLLIIPAVIAVLVFLALTPFFIILKQVAFFENVRVIASIKRAWTLGFQNFFKNWAFFILYLIPVVIVSIIGSAVLDLTALTILLLPLGILVFIAMQVWINAFSFLFKAQVYNLDVSGTALAVQKKLPAVRKQTAISPVEEKKQEIASKRFAVKKRTETLGKKLPSQKIVRKK